MGVEQLVPGHPGPPVEPLTARQGPCPRCVELERQSCRFCDPPSEDHIVRPDLSTRDSIHAYMSWRSQVNGGAPLKPPHRIEDCRYTKCCPN